MINRVYGIGIGYVAVEESKNMGGIKFPESNKQQMLLVFFVNLLIKKKTHCMFLVPLKALYDICSFFNVRLASVSICHLWAASTDLYKGYVYVLISTMIPSLV